MKDVKIRYTCPAFPPENINIGLIYLFGNDKTGYYYKESVVSKPIYADLDFIKMLFTPVDSDWIIVLGK